MQKEFNPTLQFQTIQSASRVTGLSQYFLRKGCRDGSVPYVMSGKKYLVNVPLLLDQLNQESLRERVSG